MFSIPNSRLKQVINTCEGRELVSGSFLQAHTCLQVQNENNTRCVYSNRHWIDKWYSVGWKRERALSREFAHNFENFLFLLTNCILNLMEWQRRKRWINYSTKTNFVCVLFIFHHYNVGFNSIHYIRIPCVLIHIGNAIQ